MADLPVGTWIRRFLESHCAGCGRTVEYPPGTVSEDTVWEVRICPDCGAPWKSEAVYAAAPGEATEDNAF